MNQDSSVWKETAEVSLIYVACRELNVHFEYSLCFPIQELGGIK